MAQRTGMIGLGAMGLQMAKHMAAKGFEVYGHDIDVGATQRAGGVGVRTCDAAQVARQAETVVVMVQTDAQVQDVIRGLLDHLAKGSVICIASSVAPDTC